MSESSSPSSAFNLGALHGVHTAHMQGGSSIVPQLPRKHPPRHSQRSVSQVILASQVPVKLIITKQNTKREDFNLTVHGFLISGCMVPFRQRDSYRDLLYSKTVMSRFKCAYYKEMINRRGNEYVNQPGLTILQTMCVSSEESGLICSSALF